MKAITITQQLKDANQKLFNNFSVGSIRQMNIPNSFVSLNYNAGQRTDGYRTLDNSIHESDGFYDVVTPTVDPALERLGAIFFDVTVFTYPIVPLTQQEQDDYQQAQEDSDASSQLQNKYKSDGEFGFDRAYSLIIRKRDNGTITTNQAVTLSQGLYPSLEPLYKGLWQLVKQNLAAETPPANADLLDIFNKIVTGVDNYVAENY